MQIQELEENKPPGVKIKFDDPNTLSDFHVIISPEDGYWAGGRFKFHVKIPLDYNMSPPDVLCLTKSFFKWQVTWAALLFLDAFESSAICSIFRSIHRNCRRPKH